MSEHGKEKTEQHVVHACTRRAVNVQVSCASMNNGYTIPSHNGIPYTGHKKMLLNGAVLCGDSTYMYLRQARGVWEHAPPGHFVICMLRNQHSVIHEMDPDY